MVALPAGMEVSVYFVEQQNNLPGDPEAELFRGKHMLAPGPYEHVSQGGDSPNSR